MFTDRVRFFVAKERAYLGDLTSDQRRLLISTWLYTLALPMISVFSNTYLWRQSQDPVVLCLFNIGHYSGLALGFILNGLMLRRFAPQKLCALGSILQGLVPLVLVFLGPDAHAYAGVLGLALGVSGGFYWGNRNLLTSQVTQGPQRFKYISLEQIISISSAVFAPLVVGWFLVVGERTGWYPVQIAYQLSAVAGLCLLLWCGRNLALIERAFLPTRRLMITRASRTWNYMRTFDFFNGWVNGLEASVLFFALLIFLSKENVIGTLLSFTAVLAAIGMYALGKRARHRDHTAILGLWTGVTLIGKAVFAITYSAGGAVVLQSLEGLAKSFRWASASAVMYESIELQQPDKRESERYAYLIDRELSLNLGRVTALAGVILIYQQAPDVLFRYGLFAAVGAQLIMIIFAQVLTGYMPQRIAKKL